MTAQSRRGSALAAAGVLAIALLTFYFPGHTYLQSDTQIYVPMLERIENPSALALDLSATRPHLDYTLYDELTLAIRRVTGADWREALMAQQFACRAAGVLGIYLLAGALGLERRWAMLVAGWSSLGAVVAGPAVLSIEYEPVPRGFAVALTLLALGLACRGAMFGAGALLCAAILYHPPTAAPMLAVFVVLAVVRRQWRSLAPLAAAAGILAVAAHMQAGQTEHQTLFAVIDPSLAALQRLRAPYNWVSMWGGKILWQYPLLASIALAALWRLRPRATPLWFAGGLVALGLLSVAASWVLLEGAHWTLIPQFQPSRAVLFVELLAVVLASCAAVRVGQRRRYAEALAWLTLVFAVPQQARLLDFFSPGLADPLIARRVLVALCCAAAFAALVRFRLRGWAWPLAAACTVAAFFAIPRLGGVENYPAIETPELRALSNYALENTPPDAVFLFPGAGHGLEPGIFRAEAIRAVYVDWKSGGQANYYRDLAFEWWRRWKATMAAGAPPPSAVRYRALGIAYAVLNPSAQPPGWRPVYANSAYALYRIADPPAASGASGEKLLDLCPKRDRRLGAPARDRDRRGGAGEPQSFGHAPALGASHGEGRVERVPGGGRVHGFDDVTGLEEFDVGISEESALMADL